MCDVTAAMMLYGAVNKQKENKAKRKQTEANERMKLRKDAGARNEAGMGARTSIRGKDSTSAGRAGLRVTGY
tara:strand:- start:1698 stop:1913 length:216 start_codon:yes stop_codon:yes gene_type:complete